MLTQLRETLDAAGYCVSVSRMLLNRRQLIVMVPDLIIQGAQTAGPHSSGLHYLTMMRRDPAVAGIPVILVTASQEMVRDPMAARSLRRLGVRVLRQPFGPDQLLTMITEELETRKRIDDMWRG